MTFTVKKAFINMKINQLQVLKITQNIMEVILQELHQAKKILIELPLTLMQQTLTCSICHNMHWKYLQIVFNRSLN